MRKEPKTLRNKTLLKVEACGCAPPPLLQVLYCTTMVPVRYASKGGGAKVTALSASAAAAGLRPCAR